MGPKDGFEAYHDSAWENQRGAVPVSDKATFSSADSGHFPINQM
ncbi:MAG: hypothetical protein QOJ26_586 [Thermoplasmata archaeon]|nr:hypothetical protein [Thermoplasmata archaeon]